MGVVKHTMSVPTGSGSQADVFESDFDFQDGDVLSVVATSGTFPVVINNIELGGAGSLGGTVSVKLNGETLDSMDTSSWVESAEYEHGDEDGATATSILRGESKVRSVEFEYADGDELSVEEEGAVLLLGELDHLSCVERN